MSESIPTTMKGNTEQVANGSYSLMYSSKDRNKEEGECVNACTDWTQAILHEYGHPHGLVSMESSLNRIKLV